MILQKIKTLPLAFILGGAVSVTTALTFPAYTGAGLAFSGGILGGAAVMDKKRQEEEIKREQATRVSTCFTTLYEKNQGLIDPVQLAFFANISADRAHAFLLSLAESNNGQKIATEQGVGVVFNFPHPDNVLERLSKNATEWAQAQTQQLQAELEQHKRILQFMQAQQAAASLTPKAQDPDPWTPQPGV
jgi:hypothetical protein